MIPARNVPHLMLRKEVVEAVRRDVPHLGGRDHRRRDRDPDRSRRQGSVGRGGLPAESLFGRVDAKLRELARSPGVRAGRRGPGTIRGPLPKPERRRAKLSADSRYTPDSLAGALRASTSRARGIPRNGHLEVVSTGHSGLREAARRGRRRSSSCPRRTAATCSSASCVPGAARTDKVEIRLSSDRSGKIAFETRCSCGSRQRCRHAAAVAWATLRSEQEIQPEVTGDPERSGFELASRDLPTIVDPTREFLDRETERNELGSLRRGSTPWRRPARERKRRPPEPGPDRRPGGSSTFSACVNPGTRGGIGYSSTSIRSPRHSTGAARSARPGRSASTPATRSPVFSSRTTG